MALEVYAKDPEAALPAIGYTLAMCLWHLGEGAEARRIYDRSAAWTEQHLPDSPLLHRQRREAAELLGLR